jgi:CHAD domain-containing protein
VAYCFERGEPVPEGIRRIAREQLEGAIDSLHRKGKHDEAIHDARRRVKKTRALLRLVKLELGEVYDPENIRLRDAGRVLSEFRDAAAIIESFDALREKYRGELGERSLETVRHGLLLHKARTERTAKLKAALGQISSVLAASAKGVDEWPLATDGFPAIAQGLEQTYRSGRKAMVLARQHPRPEHFHEWRKRVKDHWYHIRLLEDVWRDVMGGFEKSLKQLEDWLGNDHNLEVLRGRVTSEPDAYGPAEDIDALLHLIGRSQEDLRGRSLAMGDRLYLDRPSRFRSRMGRLWETWQG